MYAMAAWSKRMISIQFGNGGALTLTHPSRQPCSYLSLERTALLVRRKEEHMGMTKSLNVP